MANEEPVREDLFAFTILSTKYANGQLDVNINMKNTGVLDEVVLMQLKALLRNLENDFFDDYDQRIAKMKSDQ